MATESDLPHRVWSHLRDLWLDHVPGDLAPSDVDLLARVSELHGRPADKTFLPLIAGLREQVLVDALFLRSKSIYCVDCASSCNDQGFSTWSATLMYDASFFAAKSFCYLMGIRDLSRDSKVYVDAFHQDLPKKRPPVDGHLVLHMADRMTHEMLWKIFHRIVRTMTIDLGQYQAEVLHLRRFDIDKFSHERNRILYKPFSWSREDALSDSDIYDRITYEDNRNFIDGDMAKAEYFDKYYFLAFAINNVVDTLLGDIGLYAPAINTEVAARPGPRKLASLHFA